MGSPPSSSPARWHGGCCWRLVSPEEPVDAPESGEEPVDWQGRPVRCDGCPAVGAGADCQLGVRCAQDRLSARIERFFFANPQLADDWLTHPHFAVRVAASRRASLFRVVRLVTDPDESVRAAVALRAPQRLLERMAGDENREVRIRVAQQLAPSRLELMRNDPDYYVRAWVARRVPLQQLLAMARDPEPLVRFEVAQRVEPGSLRWFLEDEDLSVRRVVARRGGTHLLRILARDASWRVRLEVAHRAWRELAQQFTGDSEPVVVEAARLRLHELGAD